MSRVSRFALLMLFAALDAAYSAGGNKKRDVNKRKRRRSDMGIKDPTSAYGWSKYRYTQYKKQPHDQDKLASMLAGGDVKCDVCEVILTKALQDLTKAKKLTGGPMDQDNIEEALEADIIDLEKVEKAESRMEKYVEKYKKGCNRLFKENFLQLGWDVAPCHQQLPFDMDPQPPEGRIPWACARDMRKVPSKVNMNTYTVERESIHYACEATITRHRDDLARFVAENYEEYKKHPHKKLAAVACKEAAKCKVRKPTETVEARAKKIMGMHESRHGDLDEQLKKLQKEYGQGGKAKKRKQQQNRKSEL